MSSKAKTVPGMRHCAARVHAVEGSELTCGGVGRGTQTLLSALSASRVSASTRSVLDNLQKKMIKTHITHTLLLRCSQTLIMIPLRVPTSIPVPHSPSERAVQDACSDGARNSHSTSACARAGNRAHACACTLHARTHHDGVANLRAAHRRRSLFCVGVQAGDLYLC